MRPARLHAHVGPFRAVRLAVAATLVAMVAPLWSPPQAGAAITPLPSWGPVGATPATRSFAPGAYDANTGQFVMFGGVEGDGSLGDTWTFDGRVWTQVTGTGPSASDAGPMAYDPVIGKIVMLSGTGTVGAFDGAAWTQLSTGGPTGQASGFLVFDAAIGQLVLYGTNTWTSDGTTWTMLSPATSPTVGTPAGMVYDRDRQRVVLVVGTETWSFDGVTWTQVPTAHVPPARTYAAMAYDAVGRRVVLFGGYNLPNDTWVFDGTDWAQLTTPTAPSGRPGPTADYDAALGAVVLFGGGSPSDQNDTWLLSGSAWAQVGTANLETAYDAALGTAFGVGADGSTWAWDGQAWLQRNAAGTVAIPDALVYDAADHQLVAYGNDGSTTVSDGTTWTKLTPAHTPTAAKGGASVAYDSTHGNVVLFGGNGALTSLDETWIWDGTDWTQQFPAHTPPARQGAAMVDDPAHGDVVLDNGISDPTGGTWTWSGSDWTSQATTTTPTVDYPPGADYNADLGGPAVTAPTTSGNSKSWLWDGTDWQSQSPSVTLAYGTSEVFDAARHQLVLTAGVNTGAAVVAQSWVSSTVAYSVAVSAADSVINADGAATTTATATVTDATHTPVSGLPVVFRASGGQPLSAVTDHHDGTYSVTLTSTTDRGPFSVTARIGTAAGSAAFSQGQTLSFSPSVVAFGNRRGARHRAAPVLAGGDRHQRLVGNGDPRHRRVGDRTRLDVGRVLLRHRRLLRRRPGGRPLLPGDRVLRPGDGRPAGRVAGVPRQTRPTHPSRSCVSGTGTSVVTLSFSPSPLAFGSDTVGVATPQSVTVTNVGAQTITINAAAWNGANGDFAITTDNCTGHVLAVNATCTVTVTFTPGSGGGQNAVLQFTHTGPDSPQSLSVTGTGVVGTPTITPPSFDFGAVPTDSTSGGQTFTLDNPANGTPVTISSVGLSGATPGQFGITSGCNGTIAAGGSCSVTVTFSPTEICTASAATLSIATNSVTLSSSLTGTATPPSSTGVDTLTSYCTTPKAQPQDFSPGPDGKVWFDEWGSAFASPAVASISTTGVLTERTNVISSPLLPFNITLGGDGNAWLHQSQYGYYAQLEMVTASGAFTQFIPPPGGPPLLAEKTASYNDVLGPDGNVWTGESDYACSGESILDRIDPTGLPHTTVLDNTWAFHNIPSKSSTPCLDTSHLAVAPDGTAWATSTNSAPAVSGLVHFDTQGDLIGFVPMLGVEGITVGPDGKLWVTTVSGSGPVCSLTELTTTGATATVDQTISAPTGFFNCANPTFGPDGRLWLLGQDTSTIPFNQALFGITTGGVVTTYDEPGIVPIPSYGVVTGPDEGLWLRTGASTIARFDLGGGPARGFLTPATVGFQSTPPNVASPSRTITLYSTGTAALHVSGVTITGSGYQTTADGCTGTALAPGDTCTVSVASVPTSTHSQSATLVFHDDDGFPATQRVALATFITPPPPTFNPTKLVFAPLQVGATSGPATITLTNPADIPLTMDGVSTGGTNFADFSVTSGTCTGVIPAGGNCTVQVTFHPSMAAPESATVVFADSAIVSTQTVILTGGGTAPGGGGCLCATAGPFVQPDVFEPAESATSPNNVYTLATVGQGQNGFPTELDVSKGGSVIARIPGPVTANGFGAHSWGFSPDDNRFVVHYETPDPINAGQFTDEVDFYDLSVGTAQSPVTHPARSFTDTATQAVGFSPGGIYLIVVSPVAGSAQIDILDATTAPYANTYSGTVTVGSLAADEDTGDVQGAGWGFSPGDKAFVDYYIDSNGYGTYDLVNVATGAKIWTGGGSGVVADYPTFSPCGDAMAYVRQDSAGAPGTESVDMISTTDGHKYGGVTGLAIGNVTVSVVPPQWQISDLSSAPGLSPELTTYAATIPGCTSANSTSTTAGGGGVTMAPLRPAGSARLFAPLITPSVGPITAMQVPDGRGELDLPADVTPAPTTFTYTETPVGHPASNLVPVGPGFHLDAADVGTGTTVNAFTDAVAAQLSVTADDLSAAGLADASGVGLYWWNGTVWVPQTCTQCGPPAAGIVTGSFTQPGDFALFATAPTDPAVGLAGVAISTTVGTAFSGPVAIITPADAFDTPSDYTVTIDWGDGTSGSGAVSGSFGVLGAHTWSASGSHTVTVTLHDGTGTQSVVATATVAPTGATHFVVSAPASATSGTPVNVTVTAEDATNNVATGYTGTVHLTSSDAGASLPADFTLTAGTAMVAATLETAGSQSLTATDTVTNTITGSTSVAVAAGAASASASTVTAAPASVPADGVSSSTVTVTLMDAAGNAASGRTVTVGSTGHGTVKPASAVTNAGGTATFTVTDTTAESVTLTATDTSDAVTVTPTAGVTFTAVASGGADVAIGLSAGRLSAGEGGYYVATVTNTGTAATTGTLTVTDTLPVGTSYLGALSFGWHCGAKGQVVACTTTARIAAGGHSSILLVVSVRARAGTSLTDTAQVAMATADPTPADNTATVTVVVRRG